VRCRTHGAVRRKRLRFVVAARRPPIMPSAWGAFAGRGGEHCGCVHGTGRRRARRAASDGGAASSRNRTLTMCWTWAFVRIDFPLAIFAGGKRVFTGSTTASIGPTATTGKLVFTRLAE
jgi:hypothetical protein